MQFISLDTDKDAGWRRVRACVPFLSADWEKKLRYGGKIASHGRTGLEKVVQGILIEPDYVCRDYRNLYSNFYSKKFAPFAPYCTRLHFFSKSNISVDDICYESEKYQDSYIGYSVIQPVEHHCIGRTVIDPRKCDFDTEIYCLQTKDVVTIRGAKYTVHGFPFISQSGEVMVCSHAALWGTTRYLSEKHKVYAELKPFDLIQLTGDTNGRRYPHRGMRYRDYSSILTKFGGHPIVLFPYLEDRKQGASRGQTIPDRKILLEIASYLESGLPVLASFGGHVVTLVGHTLYPKNELAGILSKSEQNDYGFYDSYDMLRHYIVIDDNFFPYQKLGSESESCIENNYALDAYSGQLSRKLGKDTIYAAVIPVPEKVFMTAGAARDIAQKFFYGEMRHQYFDYCTRNSISPSLNKSDVIKHFLDKFLYLEAKNDDSSSVEYRLIARTFFTSSKAFKYQKNMDFRRSKDDGDLFPTAVSLPHFIWVVEFSTVGLYNDEEILGEVVLDATWYKSGDAILYSRVLNKTLVDGNVFESNKKTFTLFRHNLGER
jgi:hypothetical protein